MFCLASLMLFFNVSPKVLDVGYEGCWRKQFGLLWSIWHFHLFDVLMYTFIMIQIVVNQASPTSFSSYPWTSKKEKKRVGEKLKLGNISSYKYHSTYLVHDANLFGIGFVLNHVCTSAGRALILTCVCDRVSSLECSLGYGVPVPVQCRNSARCTKGHGTISLEGAQDRDTGLTFWRPSIFLLVWEAFLTSNSLYSILTLFGLLTHSFHFWVLNSGTWIFRCLFCTDLPLISD